MYVVVNELGGEWEYQNKETAWNAFVEMVNTYREDFKNHFNGYSFMMDDYERHPFDEENDRHYFDTFGFCEYYMWAMDDDSEISIHAY